MSDEHLRGDGPRGGYGDAIAVLRFTETMLVKLAENNYKGTWTGPATSTAYLLDRLDDEVVELRRACQRRKAKSFTEIQLEAADVANFAMMIADRARQGLA